MLNTMNLHPQKRGTSSFSLMKKSVKKYLAIWLYSLILIYVTLFLNGLVTTTVTQQSQMLRCQTDAFQEHRRAVDDNNSKQFHAETPIISVQESISSENESSESKSSKNESSNGIQVIKHKPVIVESTEITETEKSPNLTQIIIEDAKVKIMSKQQNSRPVPETKDMNSTIIAETEKSTRLSHDEEPNAIVAMSEQQNYLPEIKDVNSTSAHLWRGYNKYHQINVSNIKNVEIVVAYCKNDLTWMDDTIINVIPPQSNIKLSFVSKCGQEANIPQFDKTYNNVELNVIKIENVGGCDNAYAHFINLFLENIKAERDKGIHHHDLASTIILFLKDTPRTRNANPHNEYHRPYTPFNAMLATVSNGEFACGLRNPCRKSPYNIVKQLQHFTMRDYVRHGERTEEDEEKMSHKNDGNLTLEDELVNPNFNDLSYGNLGVFHKKVLKWNFPTNITKVCYGGSFAIPATRLFHPTFDDGMIFQRIEKVTTRNENTLEEHFIERTWAGLFDKALTDEEISIINNIRNRKADCPLKYEGAVCATTKKSPTCVPKKT